MADLRTRRDDPIHSAGEGQAERWAYAVAVELAEKHEARWRADRKANVEGTKELIRLWNENKALTARAEAAEERERVLWKSINQLIAHIQSVADHYAQYQTRYGDDLASEVSTIGVKIGELLAITPPAEPVDAGKADSEREEIDRAARLDCARIADELASNAAFESHPYRFVRDAILKSISADAEEEGTKT